MNLAPGVVIGERYRIDRMLGQGGMGIVVQATHLVLEQRVAIKFLRREAMSDPDAVRRFVREAQAAAKVQSEYVVRVQDVASLPDGTPFIVMEYVEGVGLAPLMASRGALPIREAVRYALQTCEALAATHAAGIVHGDLKPENIFIAGSDGPRRVKVLDFGISKIVFEEQPSVILGTPSYMAPEQLSGGTVTTTADIWALGVLLYEMLAGTLPFRGDGVEGLVKSVTRENVPPIQRADLPAGLFDVVQRCLEKDASRRWANAAALVAALEPFAESATERVEQVSMPVNVVSTQRHAPTVVVSRREGGYGGWVLLAAVIGIAGVVLVTVSITRRARPVDLDRPTSAAVPAQVAPAPAPPEVQTAEARIPEMTPSQLPSARKVNVPTPRRRPSHTAVPAPAAPTPTPSEEDRFGTRK
jgi:serine/threonine-protein kinase